MTVILLTVEETVLGGVGAASSGTVTVEYVAGVNPHVSVDGQTVTLPKTITVNFTAGELDASLDVEPTRGVCAARVTVRSAVTGVRFRRYVSIPTTGPVAFGDLSDVDPATFQPTIPTPSLTETIDNRIAEYLAEHGGGAGAVDNGDGTITLTGSNITDNGDGTLTIGA